jgi:hypothetical protein
MVKISRKHIVHVKAKKGQILILVLMLMAVGLIVISPLLAYLNTSYNIYAGKLEDATAYYTVDAMMGKIFGDMYTGANVYILNRSDSTRYNNQSASGWLNGYNISTYINNSIASPPPPSLGETADWIYRDPGCDFGLNTLAHSDDPANAYKFNMSLTEGTSVMSNWYFQDSKSGSCNYTCSGVMWIAYANGSAVPGATTGILPFTNAGFSGNLNWTVPPGGTDNYSVRFQNLATRKSGTGCGTTSDRSMSQMFVKPTFSGIGDPLYTWVRLGNSYGGQVYLFQDYTITITARRVSTNTDVLTITACVRQTPGPLQQEDHQTLAVVSWTVTYY